MKKNFLYTIATSLLLTNLDYAPVQAMTEHSQQEKLLRSQSNVIVRQMMKRFDENRSHLSTQYQYFIDTIRGQNDRVLARAVYDEFLRQASQKLYKEDYDLFYQGLQAARNYLDNDQFRHKVTNQHLLRREPSVHDHCSTNVSPQLSSASLGSSLSSSSYSDSLSFIRVDRINASEIDRQIDEIMQWVGFVRTFNEEQTSELLTKIALAVSINEREQPYIISQIARLSFDIIIHSPTLSDEVISEQNRKYLEVIKMLLAYFPMEMRDQTKLLNKQILEMGLLNSRCIFILNKLLSLANKPEYNELIRTRNPEEIIIFINQVVANAHADLDRLRR